MSTPTYLTNADLDRLGVVGLRIRGKTPTFYARVAHTGTRGTTLETLRITARKDTLNDAIKAANLLKVRDDRGGVSAHKANPKVSTLLQNWWDHIEQTDPKRHQGAEVYELRYWQEKIGRLQVHEITPSLVRQLLRQELVAVIPSRKKLKDGDTPPPPRRKSRRTAERKLKFLRARLNEWVNDREFIDPETGHPAKVSPLHGFDFSKEKGYQPPRPSALSVEQWHALLRYGFIVTPEEEAQVKSTAGRQRLEARRATRLRDLVLVLAALQTTFRVGELLRLTFSQLDYEHEMATVNGRVTKNGDPEPVPVLRWLQDLIHEHCQPNPAYPDIIFWHRCEAENTLNFKGSVRYAVKQACQRADRLSQANGGPAIPYVNPHMLTRNGGAAQLADQGATAAELQHIMQHADSKMSLSYVEKAGMKKRTVPEVVRRTFDVFKPTLKLVAGGATGK